MKYTKQEKAARLFRAIGEIDDVLVQEAQTYRPQRRTGAARMILLAAALSFSVLLMFSTILISMRSDRDKATGDTDESIPKLDQIFLSQRNDANYTTLSSEEELPFFDGETYLVWQYADSDELCISRALTRSEITTLNQSMGKGDRVGETSPELSCRVWMLCCDGKVLSPYLEVSAGNVGSAQLFDYEAELIPSEDFTSCISGILN